MTTPPCRARHWTAILLTALLAVASLVAAACSTPDPLASRQVPRALRSVVVGSADFPESKIVAEIYAQTLEVNGFAVERQFGIGSRETYIPALKSQSIDLVPDYIGNLLLYFEPDATATTPDYVELALHRDLPGSLSILTPAPAADAGTVTVTAETAEKWHLKTIADLAPYSAEVRFAAPPEFQTRPQGLAGLRQRYSLEITPANFVPISDGGGPATVNALVNGTVTAANIFSTSPAIPQNHLVTLQDPLYDFLAGNVVPLMNTHKKSDQLKSVLDTVSAKLTTAGLAELNAEVWGNGGVDLDQAAKRWVRDQGFDEPLGT